MGIFKIKNMTITTISYKKVFPIGSYLTEHIGLEATLDTGESPEVALQRLQIIVNDLHKETLASMEEYRGTTVKTVEELQVDKVPDELTAALNGIENSKDITELHGFWLLSKSNLMLSAAYQKKLKQLEDAK
jgi:hypothetical protein